MTQVRLLLLLSVVNDSMLLDLMNLEEPLVEVDLLTSVDFTEESLEFIKVLIKIVEFLCILAFFDTVEPS